MAAGVVVLVAGMVAMAHRAPPPGFDAPAAEGGPPAAGPAPAALITVPADPAVLFLGDSYTQGHGAETDEQGWAYQASAALGWPSEIDGVGGTGYTYSPKDTPRKFIDRVEERIADGEFTPNVVVVQGGQNDWRATRGELNDAVQVLVQRMREAWPGVQIVMLGPSAPKPLGNDQDRVDGWLAAAAFQAQVPYISPFREAWLTAENSPGFAFTDGSHLNTAGHAYLAQRFLEAFAAVQAPPA